MGLHPVRDARWSGIVVVFPFENEGYDIGNGRREGIPGRPCALPSLGIYLLQQPSSRLAEHPGLILRTHWMTHPYGISHDLCLLSGVVSLPVWTTVFE